MLDDAIQKALQPRSSSTPPSPRCPTCGNGREDMECSNAFHIAPPSPTQETPAKIRTESLREHKRNCALNRGVGPPWVCTCKSVPEETPAELTESLDELRDADAAYFGWTPTTSPPDWADDIKPLEDRVIAARSALVSLYTRQREEIDQWRRVAESDEDLQLANDQLAALSSQLERLTEENARLRSHKCTI